MPSFEIPDGPTTVPLMSQSVKGKAMRTATVTFTVTNKTPQPLSCRLKAAPQADAKDEWFELQGEKERPFAASETQKVTVNVAVPADEKPADFKFRLQAMNVNDPDNDFAESATATLSIVVPKPPKPARVWPYILVALILVLIVGGVAGVMLWPKPTPQVTPISVPNEAGVGKLYTDAQTALATQHFVAVRLVGAAYGNPPETVMSQMPLGGTPVAPPTAAVPMQVSLTVDPGVSVPSYLVGTPVDNISNQLAQFTPTVTELGDDGPNRVVASFDPPSGVFKLGYPLTVYIHSPGCHTPVCEIVRNQPWKVFKENASKVKGYTVVPSASTGP